MISAEEYENLVEDLTLMKDRKFMAKVKKADEEFANGEYRSWDSIKKDLLVKTGTMVLADESKNKYVSKGKKGVNKKGK